MTIKMLSRLLIVAGLILIVYAVGMDVTVGAGGQRVMNLHKASHQSNMLMLGGFLFLSGIIALVASRSKGIQDADKELSASTEQATRQSVEKLKGKSQEAFQSAHQAVETHLHHVMARNESGKRIGMRVVGGAVAGLLASGIFDLFARLTLLDIFYNNIRLVFFEYSDEFEVACFAYVLWQAMSRLDIERYFKAVFRIELVAYGVFFAFAIVASLFADLNEGILAGIVIKGIISAAGLALANKAVNRMAVPA